MKNKIDTENINESAELFGAVAALLMGSIFYISRTLGESPSVRNELGKLFGVDLLRTDYLGLDEIQSEEIKKEIWAILETIRKDENLKRLVSKIKEYEQLKTKLTKNFNIFKENLPNNLGVDKSKISTKEKRMEYFKNNPNTKYAKEYKFYVDTYTKLNDKLRNIYQVDIENVISQAIGKKKSYGPYSNMEDAIEVLVKSITKGMDKDQVEDVKNQYLKTIENRSRRLIGHIIGNTTEDSKIKRSLYMWFASQDPYDTYGN